MGNERSPVSNGHTRETGASTASLRNAVRCGIPSRAWLPTEPFPYSFQIGCMFPISVRRFSAKLSGALLVQDIVADSAGPGTTPERVATTRDMAIQIAGNLKPIVAVVLPVHDPAGDFAPDAGPCWTVLHSERIGKTRRVSIREIEADQHHLSSAGEPSKDLADLAHCLAARRQDSASATTESLPPVRATKQYQMLSLPVTGRLLALQSTIRYASNSGMVVNTYGSKQTHQSDTRHLANCGPANQVRNGRNKFRRGVHPRLPSR